ncbi:MAG: alpha/beta hydrolase [Kofleriaceae bacterium]
MAFAHANQIRFHTAELGAGPTVVMAHGLLVGSLASWYFTAAPVLARTHRVRLYDLRGHGKSDRPTTGYDTATMVDDLAGLTADLTAPFDLVGHSYGALVALGFALRFPARVRRLVVVEAPLPPGQVAEGDAWFAAGPDHLVAALPAPLRDAVAGGRRQAARLLANLRALAEDTTLLADLRAEPDLADDALGQLAAPTLCAYGDRSSCLPAGRRLAAALPAARLVVLPGGHYLHLDAKDALAAAIAEHLGG